MVTAAPSMRHRRCMPELDLGLGPHVIFEQARQSVKFHACLWQVFCLSVGGNLPKHNGAETLWIA